MTGMDSIGSSGGFGAASLDYGPAGARAFDSDDGTTSMMDEADRLHAEMSSSVSGMGDPPRQRDHVSSAVRKYMEGSVRVSVEAGGRAISMDCLEVLTCRNGATLVYREDRNPDGLPDDGCACSLSLGSSRMECRYTGISWKSPGLGICGAAFIFVPGR